MATIISTSALPGTGLQPEAGNSKKGSYYQLLIYPEGHTADQVRQLRDELQAAGNAELAVLQQPSIRLGSFMAGEEMEETLLRWIQRICREEKRFAIRLNNFGSLPSQSLFLRVMEHEPLRRLTSRLRVIDDFIASCGYGVVEWSGWPVCSLAHAADPLEAWQLARTFAAREFSGSFVASSLVLVRQDRLSENQVLVHLFPFIP